jgi:hypothetical protein
MRYNKITMTDMTDPKPQTPMEKFNKAMEVIVKVPKGKKD